MKLPDKFTEFNRELVLHQKKLDIKYEGYKRMENQIQKLSHGRIDIEECVAMIRRILEETEEKIKQLNI